jgi:hypothetical protein
MKRMRWLRACNRAANRASEVAFAKELKRRNVLQDEVYYTLKTDFDLGAQPAVRTIKKVCDAYATLKGNLKAGNLGPEGSKRRTRAESKPIVFREDAAQPTALLGLRPTRLLHRVQSTTGRCARGPRGPAQHLPPVLRVLAHPPDQPSGPSTVRLPILRDRHARGPQRLPQHRPPGRCCAAAGRSQPPQSHRKVGPDAGDQRGSQPRSTCNQRPSTESTSRSLQGREVDSFLQGGSARTLPPV